MADSVQLTIPWNTTVYVKGFANASYSQRVTVSPAGQAPFTFQGQGFYDTSIGTSTLSTGSGSGEGLAVTVTVEHSSDGVNWSPSQVDWDSCVIEFTTLLTVASEDSVDDTWDDATTLFCWTSPPS